MDASEVLIRSLDDAGIDYAFGLPGSVIMNTIDKFHGKDIEFITTRHEQVATSMADGYARVTGRPGVTLAHVGPGAANQIVGVGAAYRDASPVVAISGNEDRPRLGRNVWHEWDVGSVFEPITKWNTRIERGDDAARLTRQALVTSLSGRPGPVHIDLPKDVSREASSYPASDEAFYEEHQLRMPMDRPAPGPSDVERTLAQFRAASKPIILAGGGCVRSEAGDVLRELVEHLEIPVVTSNSGWGVLSERHPLSLGVVGTRGTDAANAAVQEADMVLALGARFSALSTDNWSLIDPGTAMVQVDIHPEEFASQYPVEVSVMADARAFLEALLDTDISGGWSGDDLTRVKRAVESELDEFFDYPESDEIGPRHLYAVLQDERDDDAIITSGGGVHSAFGKRISALTPQSHLKSLSFGSMGYGFPMAMGAKLGAPDRQVICVEGDGGFAMVMQDLETAVRYDIDVKTVVYNNYSYGSQKLRQGRLFGERYLGTDVVNPRFDRIAEEYGVAGLRVEDPGDLRGQVEALLETEGPALLEVVVDPWVWPGTDEIAQI